MAKQKSIRKIVFKVVLEGNLCVPQLGFIQPRASVIEVQCRTDSSDRASIHIDGRIKEKNARINDAMEYIVGVFNHNHTSKMKVYAGFDVMKLNTYQYLRGRISPNLTDFDRVAVYNQEYGTHRFKKMYFTRVKTSAEWIAAVYQFVYKKSNVSPHKIVWSRTCPYSADVRFEDGNVLSLYYACGYSRVDIDTAEGLHFEWTANAGVIHSRLTRLEAGIIQLSSAESTDGKLMQMITPQKGIDRRYNIWIETLFAAIKMSTGIVLDFATVDFDLLFANHETRVRLYDDHNAVVVCMDNVSNTHYLYGYPQVLLTLTEDCVEMSTRHKKHFVSQTLTFNDSLASTVARYLGGTEEEPDRLLTLQNKVQDCLAIPWKSSK